MIRVLSDMAVKVNVPGLNSPLPEETKGTLTTPLAAKATTVMDPWQPFLASPTKKLSLYALPFTVLTTWAMALSLPATSSTAASPEGTTKWVEST